MPRIAVFGGAFDPFHTGHAVVISALLNSNLFDFIYVVPSGIRPEKPCTASPQQRCEMLEIGLKSADLKNNKIIIERCQIDGSISSSFTVDLLSFLKQREPGSTFSFVIGADNLNQLKQWKDPEKLAQLTKFIVLPRPGQSITTPKGFKVELIEPKEWMYNGAASSEIRKLLAQGKSTAGLLYKEVADYIKLQQLYVK